MYLENGDSILNIVVVPLRKWNVEIDVHEVDCILLKQKVFARIMNDYVKIIPWW